MAITEKYVSAAGSGSADGSSEANAISWDNMIAAIVAAGVGGSAGLRYNLIQGAGAISRTTTVQTISGGGTVTSPCIIRGYKTTITDGYQGRSGSGRGALVTTNFPNITYSTGALNPTGTWIIFENLIVDTARSNPGVILAINSAVNCKFTNSSTNAAAVAVQTSGDLINCDCALTGGSGGNGAIEATTSARIIGNRVVSSAGDGIRINSSGAVVVALNIVAKCLGRGIADVATGGRATILLNTIAGNAGDNIDIVTGKTTLDAIIGNMITDSSGGYGLDGVSAANPLLTAFNRFRDNSSGSKNSATDWLAATSYSSVDSGTTGDTSTDYTDYSGNDFQLPSASPGTSAGPWGNDIGANKYGLPDNATIAAAMWSYANRTLTA